MLYATSALKYHRSRHNTYEYVAKTRGVTMLATINVKTCLLWFQYLCLLFSYFSQKQKYAIGPDFDSSLLFFENKIATLHQLQTCTLLATSYSYQKKKKLDKMISY